MVVVPYWDKPDRKPKSKYDTGGLCRTIKVCFIKDIFYHSDKVVFFTETKYNRICSDEALNVVLKLPEYYFQSQEKILHRNHIWLEAFLGVVKNTLDKVEWCILQDGSPKLGQVVLEEKSAMFSEALVKSLFVKA